MSSKRLIGCPGQSHAWCSADCAFVSGGSSEVGRFAAAVSVAVQVGTLSSPMTGLKAGFSMVAPGQRCGAPKVVARAVIADTSGPRLSEACTAQSPVKSLHRIGLIPGLVVLCQAKSTRGVCTKLEHTSRHSLERRVRSQHSDREGDEPLDRDAELPE